MVSSVCRVAKSKGYTVMSNYHLRDRNLSLKSKGLLSQILSLPDDWDYTIEGLAKINKESRDAIRASVKELEAAGYIVRCRDRDERGCLRGSVYVIYEHPQNIEKIEQDFFDKPTLENPTQEKPTLENTTQLNKEIQNKEIQNKESILSYPERSALPETDVIGFDESERAAYRSLLKQNIEFDYIAGVRQDSREDLEEIVELMTDTVCTGKRTVRIAGEDISADVVRSRFLKLNSEHIMYVMDCLSRTRSTIRNIRQYMITCLYNAPTTMGSYYSSMVRRDFQKE